MPNIVRVAQRIRRELCSPEAMIPLYAESHHLSKGAAIHVVLGPRGNPRAEWLLSCPMPMSQHSMVKGFVKDGIVFGTPLLLLSWPDLLRQAELPPRPRTQLVHEILYCLRHLIADYDAVFVADLETFYKNYERAPVDEKVQRPGWLGQTDDEFETDRFNAHLEKLIGYPKFVRAFRTTFEAFFGFALHGNQPRVLGELALTRAQCSVLHPDMLARPPAGRDDFVDHAKPADAWVAELSWLISGHSGRTDGCYRLEQRGFGNLVLIDWAKLIEIAVAQGRESILTRFLDTSNKDYVEAGVRARHAMAARWPAGVISRRPRPLRELVREYAGVELENELDRNPYEVYTLTGLMVARENYHNRSAAAHALKTILQEKKGAAPHRHILYLQYGDKDIAVIKRDGTFWFTLPYELYLAYDVRELWEGKRYRAGGTDFWHLRGINAHANGGRYHDLGSEGQKIERRVEPIPEARAFCDWANIQAAGVLEGKGWQKKLYEQRYSERIQEKLTGARQHMGPFAALEDDALREFCEKRGKAGPFTAAEWRELDNVLPQRSRVAITRRRDHLGFQHAVTKGYASYARSGYCGRRSVARRVEWRRAGVPA